MSLGKYTRSILVLTLAAVILSSHLSLKSEAGVDDDALSKILNHNNRGVALLDQYKFKEAAYEFEQILLYSRSIAPVHVNLGIAYFYDQKYDEALAALREALELSPSEIRAHYILGLIYRNQDKVEEGIAAFEAVRRQDPDDPSTNYYLGRLYMRQRDYDTAGGFFRKVIEREPYNASAHYNLATALGRSGNREAGKKEMDEFRRLQNLFGSTTVGLQYLEQGKYAVAVSQILENEPGVPGEAATSQLAVVFEEVAEEIGLEFVHAGPATVQRYVSSLEQLERELVPSMGSGAATHDYDRDGWLDIYLANAGSDGARGALYRNSGNGVFEEKTVEAGLLFSGKTMHALWGDYDNDEYPDLYLINYGPNVLYRNQRDGTFLDVTDTTGTGDGSWGMGGAFVDFDHDGDLDIYVANFIDCAKSIEARLEFPVDLPGSKNVLFRNNGDGTFENIAVSARLTGGEKQTTSLVTSDFDNSRDVDFFLLNHGDDNLLLNNLRDGTFGNAAETGAEGTGTGVGVGAGDFNRDGYIDLALPSLASSNSALLLNRGNSHYQLADGSVSGQLADGINAHNMQFFDFDNDGDLDLLAIAANLFGQAGQLTRGRNLYLYEDRGEQYVDVSGKVALDGLYGKALRGCTIGDFDRDGDLDFLVTVNGGRALFYRNEGGNRNNWISLLLHGTNSNKGAVGVKAEVQVGRHWQKQESFGAQGFLTQNSPLLHFGLGSSESVDVVRLLWPNGVLQSEIDRPANQILELDELDRKGTSCPILYVWDGRTYRFQTDFLGGSAYGSLVAPGVYNYPDTNEYVKLNREDIALKNGRVEIAMNNQLEEVILFDKVELVVVDHPEGFDVYPDEKLLPGPPYQDFRLFTSDGAKLPASAFDGNGKSVLDEISKIDRRYPEVSDALPFKGYTELHELTLDLGRISGRNTVLLMHAWIDYADSTSNLAASQAGVKLIPPYLQVQNEEGEWTTVLERMGFPAGLPKTMTVDLSGRFLSDSRLVRIVTNMKIYWDQILVEAGEQRSDYRMHRLAPVEAHLHYKGYPSFVSQDGREPKVYLYDQPSNAEWKVHVGAYTKYGEVLPLLKEQDDMFVITRSGDEMQIAFDTTKFPEPEAGWVRDYLIYVDGFGKDMDPNSAAPHFLGPLPYHGMSSFPYADNEGYPDSETYQEYLREWNTRHYYRPYPELQTLKSGY